MESDIFVTEYTGPCLFINIGHFMTNMDCVSQSFWHVDGMLLFSLLQK